MREWHFPPDAQRWIANIMRETNGSKRCWDGPDCIIRQFIF